MRMKQIFVIIPVYNESEKIGQVLRGVKKITNKVVVVDDGSSDDTAMVASKYTEWVVKHRVNLGKGAAINTGCELAFEKLGAKAVILMDGDGQHQTSDLHKFYRKLGQGHQIVLGARSLDVGMPSTRVVFNKLISHFTTWLYGKYVTDILCGFRALSKSAYEALALQSANYEIELEMVSKILKNRMKYVSVPIATIYHQTNRGMTGIDVLKVAWQMMNWRLGL